MTASNIFIIIIGLAFIIAVPMAKQYLRSSKVKGKIGEMFVGAFLSRLGDEYEVINNVTLISDGDSTQIDHIVVSLKGIWVIETKNYQGLIFGNEKDSTWNQKLGRQSFKFQNPLRQNYKHTKYLAQNLGVRESFITPIVVFLGDARFPKGLPNGVCYPVDVVKTIKSKTETIMNNAQMTGIALKIKRLGETTAEKTGMHLQNLEQKHSKI